MKKDKVVIIVISTVVLTAIIFGILMAYRIYKLPMRVKNINETIELLKNNTKEDEDFRMVRLSLYNELSRSCKMQDEATGEIRNFTKEEMEEIYKCIGGKEAVINYLNSIEDINIKREKAEDACYNLKIISNNELVELLNNN